MTSSLILLFIQQTHRLCFRNSDHWEDIKMNNKTWNRFLKRQRYNGEVSQNLLSGKVGWDL